MDTREALISLLLMASLIALVASCRQVANRSARWNVTFFLELTGTFQICAITHELCLLGNLMPKPQVALFLTYVFTVLHGWTLTGSIANPASSFQQFYKGRLGVQTWCLQTSAQFTAALLAHICMKLIWMLGITSEHTRALPETCGNPIQTTVVNAFGLEFLFSFLLHLTLLQFESMNPRLKVHLIALLITSFVYTGGNLTGAIFNPALAFSLHISCFAEQFWNYVAVYWVAPCIGSVLVTVIWDEVLPGLRREV
ncbi:aquaporin-11 [Python bivittatus]|uniref:Aquaporin-11 n=1 Tax=Python bivittatus TaxID=176946 RepID=A0A9F5J751_PYTBI|nr:aquaporin-11 [Python bivittatus]